MLFVNRSIRCAGFRLGVVAQRPTPALERAADRLLLGRLSERCGLRTRSPAIWDTLLAALTRSACPETFSPCPVPCGNVSFLGQQVSGLSQRVRRLPRNVPRLGQRVRSPAAK